MSQYLIDTLYFVKKNTTYEDVIDQFFPYDIPWNASSGMYGYEKAIYYNGIRIMFNSEITRLSSQMNGSWVYVILSGKGCRTLEDFHMNKCDNPFPWDALMNTLSSDHNTYDVRRIDIAYDFNDKYTPLVPYLIRLYLSGRVATRYSNIRYIQGSEECIYFGSPQSDCMLRIYNKLLERGFKSDDPDVIERYPFGWTRFEFQLRDFSAFSCVDHIALNSISQCFNTLLNDRVRFLKKNKLSDNVSRIPNCFWYDKAFSDLNDYSLIPSPGSAYNKEKLSRYINQCRSSMEVWLQTQFNDSLSFTDWLHKSVLRPDQKEFLESNKKESYIEYYI